MMTQEWLGILVNDGFLEKIKQHRTGHEKLEFYQEAGMKYNLAPCYFRLQDISLREKRVKAMVQGNGKWRCMRIPIPKVIHNRAIFIAASNWKRCKSLEDSGVILYNFWNRYGKLQISQILANNEEFRPYLPVTSSFSFANLQEMMRRFSSIILKPDKGTVGEGIFKLDRAQGSRWEVRFRSGKQLLHLLIPQRVLFTRLRKYMGNYPYILQETIPLATFQGSPFDIRVSVQKDGNGEWGVTGMVGKAARPGHYLSNVAQGGKVYTLPDLLSEYPHLKKDEVSQTISEVALSMVNYLSHHLLHLSDVGFDFGIDKDGHPFFIEMNGRDQRYSFAKGGMIDTWKKTYEKPVAFARYLLDVKKTRDKRAD